MPKLLGFLDKLKGIKDGLTGFFGALSFLLNVKDKIDDDLDNNGKSELQDILDKIKEIEDETVAYFKELMADVMDIVHRIEKLQAHVLEK